MAKLLIDFGDTACIGRCAHCRFGTNAISAGVRFNPVATALLERLVRYAKARGDTVRLAYMSPLLDMAELPGFESGVDTLSVSLRSLDDLKHNRAEVVARLAAFPGQAIEVALNHFALADFKVEYDFEAVFSLQHALFAALPQLREVYFGLNNNTTVESVKRLTFDSLFAAHVYVQGIEAVLGKNNDFGESQIIQTRLGDILQQRATVQFGVRQFSFGCRYVQSHDVAEAAKTSLPATTAEKLCLAIMADRVHIGHTTFTINNPLYWFSFEEFGNLLNQAVVEDQSLANVCLAAIELRESMRTM